MPSSRLLVPTLLVFAFVVPGCAFHKTARAWNGRVGVEGEPVFYTATTKVGMKLFVGIPLFGNVDVDGMIEELTEEIAESGGDRVRIVEGSTENYWYGFPPLTWIFTPVISRAHAEWQPSDLLFALHAREWERPVPKP